MAASAQVQGEIRGQRPKKPSHLRRDIIAAVVGAVFLWALIDVGIRWDRLPGLPETLIDFFGRMFLPPDVDYLAIAWEGMLVSIQMAWFTTHSSFEVLYAFI